ncbi:MAG: hypothetical protein D6722_08965 [Bacteroidetes bacterium]|nr:MAG: hypothetical protein D6722_08965 [Bacteroidota bacterium]
MNPQIDTYLLEGCGRCALYQTPDCKVHRWAPILRALRPLVLSCGLEESYKWSQPCYTWQGKNVLILTAFKDYAALTFFKGALLQDPEGLLVTPGAHSRSGRQMRFTEVGQVQAQADLIRAFIFEAIEAERAGLQVPPPTDAEPWPAELAEKCAEDPAFQAAFEALTPGRQRGYILYFSQPKQAQTRRKRIGKCLPQIFQGEGLHDGYRNSRKA